VSGRSDRLRARLALLRLFPKAAAGWDAKAGAALSPADASEWEELILALEEDKKGGPAPEIKGSQAAGCLIIVVVSFMLIALCGASTWFFFPAL